MCVCVCVCVVCVCRLAGLCAAEHGDVAGPGAGEEKVTWPRDKLFRYPPNHEVQTLSKVLSLFKYCFPINFLPFRYFELLELLQVNLDKRKKLQERCG